MSHLKYKKYFQLQNFMLQNFKPVTPSQRNLIRINHKQLRKSPLLKTKTKGLNTTSGKNNTGKITTRHKGGGHKQNYRYIDFYRKKDLTGLVTSIEYDPNRTALIASVFYFSTKEYSYIISPEGLKIGDIIKSGTNAGAYLGHSLPLYNIPEGSLIHNVSPKENAQSQLSRSAGTFSHLIEKNPNDCIIILSSGEQRKLSVKCHASIGIISNEYHLLTFIGKAGRARWLNKRPTVRGVAMNPVDHPHGGGEGRKSGKDLTPWGKPNKRGKTSNSKNKLCIIK